MESQRFYVECHPAGRRNGAVTAYEEQNNKSRDLHRACGILRRLWNGVEQYGRIPARNIRPGSINEWLTKGRFCT